MFIIRREHGRFYELNLKILNGRPTRHRYARFVKDEGNGCRFEGQREETCIYIWPALLIAVKEWMLEFIQSKLLNSSTLWHWMCCKFLIVRIIFCLAKVNTVPCMCTAAFSCSDNV